jgi:hypothetical protein
MAAPGGLGQLTCALGFVRRRKPLRDRRRLHVGFGPELIGHLEGDSNQVSSPYSDTYTTRLFSIKVYRGIQSGFILIV